MIRYFLLVVIFLTLTSLNILSENKHNLDSLEILLSETHDADRKLEIYLPLIKGYRNIDIEKSKYYANQALRLAQNTSSQEYLAKINGSLGDIAIAQDSIDLARNYYQTAHQQYEAQKNIDGIITLTTILGNIAFVKNDLSNALQFYHKAIKLAQQGNYDKRLQRLYLNIGSIFIKSNEFAESQKYTSKALVAFLEMGDTLEAAQAYSNLGIVYINIGDYQTAKKYYLEALEIYQKQNASISVASTYHQLAEIEQAKGNYNEAITLLVKAKSLAEDNIITQFEGPKQLIINNINVELGKNYILTNDLENAYKYLITGYHSSVKYRQLEYAGTAANYLHQFWEKKINPDSALFYHRLFKGYSDSLYEEVNNRKLALQEAQFNFEQQTIREKQERDKEEELRKRNRFFLLITIVILVLILLLLILLLRLNRIKMKKSEIEQDNLRNELDLKNKELTTYLIYQVKNNEFILNISNKLKKILWKATQGNKQLINELIREIETDASSDNWDEFIVRFQQVHIDFYKNLGSKYPDLTSNELRLCAFLKLNMNTKDIASITYQSEKSITVARWRLRQKLGLQKEERLSAFLTKF